MTEPAPVRLICGAPWPDRYRTPRPSDGPRWFEPLHVREPARVREALAAQVAAGADVLVAPAWTAHRRALMEIGESRRAAEWTAAAVRIAREAADEGGARRPEGSRAGVPLVAGPVPDLDTEPEQGDGRLAERGAAAERDRRTQAAILAEAGVDLLLVEPHGSVDAAVRAIEDCAETGVATWATATAERLTTDVDAWAGRLLSAGASALLVEADPTDALEELLGDLAGRVAPHPVGVLRSSGAAADVKALTDEAKRWLEAGARLVGIAEAATPEAVGAVRAAIDAATAAAEEQREAALAGWRRFLDEAAERAPGGAALWLDDAGGPPGALATQFAWTVVPVAELRRLPAARYAFVVSPDPGAEASALERVVEPGGVVAARAAGLPDWSDQLRVVDRVEDGEEMLVIARRER